MVGRWFALEPWERDQNVDYLEKLSNLPQKQKDSLLNKVKKIAFFKTGKITDRFSDTLYQKLINLLRADLVGNPLRLSRNKKQWSGSGRFAKLRMNYDEFFAMDDILCLLGITEQHITDDGWKKDQNLETRIWLTDYGRNLFADSGRCIVNYPESYDNFQEIILNKTVEIKVEDKKTGRLKKENASVPVPYDRRIDHISRMIGRVKRINKIYNKHRLTVRCADIEMSIKEVNKLLIQHIDGKIQIRRLVYTLPYYTSSSSQLNTKAIDVINTNMLCGSGGNGITILQEGSTTCADRPGAGIKGGSVIFYQYNNDMHCQTDAGNLTINNIEFEILDKRIHRVFSRESWSLHGRFYAYWNTMKKIFRKNMYLDDDDVPMVSLDFAAMH